MTIAINDLALEFVSEKLDYDPISGKFYWKESVGRYNRIPKGSLAGGLNSEGYRYIRLGGKFYRACRLAWLLVYGEWPKEEDQIDHKNGDCSDDSIENLRISSQSQNQANKKRPRNNTTGYKGVSYRKECQRPYKAQIGFNKKKIVIGYFYTPQEAHEAYLAKAKELHGKFANAGNVIEFKKVS